MTSYELSYMIANMIDLRIQNETFSMNKDDIAFDIQTILSNNKLSERISFDDYDDHCMYNPS